MFLLVPAHPGCPGQIPQSRKAVLCVFGLSNFRVGETEICPNLWPLPSLFYMLVRKIRYFQFGITFSLLHDTLQCKARSCYHLSVRSSVRLSVTLVDHDHIGGKSWKLIARTIVIYLRVQCVSAYNPQMDNNVKRGCITFKLL